MASPVATESISATVAASGMPRNPQSGSEMSNESVVSQTIAARELPPIEPALRHALVEDRRAQDQRLGIARDLSEEALDVGGVVLAVGVELDGVA